MQTVCFVCVKKVGFGGIDEFKKSDFANLAKGGGKDV